MSTEKFILQLKTYIAVILPLLKDTTLEYLHMLFQINKILNSNTSYLSTRGQMSLKTLSQIGIMSMVVNM